MERLDISNFPFSGQISLTESFRFLNTVVRTSSRQEQVVNRRESSLLKSDLGGILFTGTSVDELSGLFNRVRGSNQPFRYKNILEYSATSDPYYPCLDDTNVYQQGILVAEAGAATEMYLAKIYNFHGVQSLKIISRPVPGTVTIYRVSTINDVTTKEEVSPLLYSVNYDTGIVTFFDVTVVSGLVADFEYDTWVRFESNKLPGVVEVAPIDDQSIGSSPELLYSITSFSVTEEVSGSVPAGIYTPSEYNAFRLNIRYNTNFDPTILTLENVGVSLTAPFYAPLISVQGYCQTVIAEDGIGQVWRTGIAVLARVQQGDTAVSQYPILDAGPGGFSYPGSSFYGDYCSIAHKASIPQNVYNVIDYEVIPL